MHAIAKAFQMEPHKVWQIPNKVRVLFIRWCRLPRLMNDLQGANCIAENHVLEIKQVLEITVRIS